MIRMVPADEALDNPHRRRKKRLAPLRKIEATTFEELQEPTEETIRVCRLECGHTVRKRILQEESFAAIDAKRRRCEDCLREQLEREREPLLGDLDDPEPNPSANVRWDTQERSR